MNFKNKIFLFPLSLAVILFSSIIIIFSPVGKKTIIPLPSLTEWITYRNSEHGFEFQYPKNWYLLEDKNLGLFISNKPFSSVSTSLIPSSEQIFVKIYYFHSAFENGLGISENGNGTISDTRLINVDNTIGVQLEYLKSDQKITDEKTMADQILSTFKFLPNTSSYKISSKDALEKISKLSEVIAETKCLDYPGSKAVVRLAFEPNEENPNYQIYFEETHPNDIKLLAVFFVNANTGLITTQDNDKIISYQQWRETHQTMGCNFKPLSCGDIPGFECPQGYSCSMSETEYGRVCFLI